MRTSIKTLQRTLEIGHINPYSLESFLMTLETSGLEVVDYRLYDHSMAVHSFNSSKIKAFAKAIIRRSLLSISPKMASKVFTYHCGALCKIAPKLDIA